MTTVSVPVCFGEYHIQWQLFRYKTMNLHTISSYPVASLSDDDADEDEEVWSIF